MVCMPYREWVRRLRASLPKRICCFMVWTCRGSNRIQGCGATLRAAHGELPSDYRSAFLQGELDRETPSLGAAMRLRT